MKTAKDLELSLLLKEKQIQDLKKDRVELISSNVKLREEKLRLNDIIDELIDIISSSLNVDVVEKTFNMNFEDFRIWIKEKIKEVNKDED